MMKKYDEKPYNIPLLGDDKASGKMKLYNHLGGGGGDGHSFYSFYSNCYSNCYSKAIEINSGDAVVLNFWHNYDVDCIGNWEAKQNYHNRIFALAVCFEMRCDASYNEAIDRLKKLNNGRVLNRNIPILLVATPTKQENVNEETYCSHQDNLRKIKVAKSKHNCRFVDCSHDDKTINSQNLVDMISNLIHMEALGNYPTVDFFMNDHLSRGKFLKKALIRAQQQYVDNTYWELRKKGKRETTDKRKPTDIKSWNGADKLLEFLCGEGNDDDESYKFLVCKELFDIDALYPKCDAATIVHALRAELLANALIKNDLSGGKYSDYFKNNIISGLSQTDLLNVYDLLLKKVNNSESIDADRVAQNALTLKNLVGGTITDALYRKFMSLQMQCNAIKQSKLSASASDGPFLQSYGDLIEQATDSEKNIKAFSEQLEELERKEKHFSAGVDELSGIVGNGGDALSVDHLQKALAVAQHIVSDYMKDDAKNKADSVDSNVVRDGAVVEPIESTLDKSKLTLNNTEETLSVESLQKNLKDNAEVLKKHAALISKFSMIINSPKSDGAPNKSISSPGFQKLNDDLDNLLNPSTDTKDTSADKQTQVSGSQFVMFAFEKMYQEAGSPKKLKEIDAWTKECLSKEEVSQFTSFGQG